MIFEVKLDYFSQANAAAMHLSAKFTHNNFQSSSYAYRTTKKRVLFKPLRLKCVAKRALSMCKQEIW